MDGNLDISLVSIIMPAYNAEKFIEATLLSVIDQTYQNWELIIVDDGSTDKTVDIAKSIQDVDKRIKYIYQENKKQGAARNKALNNATGNWIAFLDADDLWHPQKLDKQLSCAKKIDADIFYTGGVIIDGHDQVITSYSTLYGSYSPIQMYKLLLEGNPIPILSVILKREWIEKVGLQDEDIRLAGCEDWDYWIRMAKAGANFYGMDENLFYYRRHDNNMSSNHINMRLAQASLLFKNFVPGFLDAKQEDKIFKPLTISLLADLVSTGRRNDANYVFNSMQKILPSRSNRINFFFIKVLGKKWKFLAKIKGRFQNLFRRLYIRG